MINNPQKITYISSDVKKNNFERLALFFLFCYYVMPQYFGVDLILFQLTPQRLSMLLVLGYILFDRKRIRELWDVICTHPLTPFFSLMLFISLYTAAYRIHFGTFMYPFIEIMCVYVLVYILKTTLSLERLIKYITIFLWILTVEGVAESFLGFSLFSKLVTMSGVYAGAMYRSGSFRIMGPCNHSLAYGLLLLTGTPIICLDYKRDKVNLLHNKWLLVLITYNVFMTGSRSSLGIFLLEIFLLFIFSENINKKKAFLSLLCILLLTVIIVVTTWGGKISNYIMLQITSIIDAAFGTTISGQFGASLQTLQNSAGYRHILTRIFTLDTFNPFIGKGNGYAFSWFVDGALVQSIDNYYVQLFMRLAYPGMVAACLIPITSWISMIKSLIKEKSGLVSCMLIGSMVYYLNLWWMDTLMTIKYVYILFVIYFAYREMKNKNSQNKNSFSRYVY